MQRRTQSRTGRGTRSSRATTLRASTRRGTKPARGQRAASKQTRTRGRAASRTGRSGQTTTDHDTIREWAEERGGVPATVTRTARGGSAGVLRIDFPGFTGERTLRKISWDDWFEKFDESDLAFLYQDETASGDCSRFFKLVNRSRSRSARPKSRTAKPATRSQRSRSRRR